MKNNTQLNHQAHKPTFKKHPLQIIASDIHDPLNVGSLFRLSDALGIEKLYLCGNTAVPPDNKINKTARATIKHVEYEYQENTETLVKSLKSSNVYIISLEITSSSLSINTEAFAKKIKNKQPVALIIGSENTGVSQTLLSLSDVSVHIPMSGNNSSMNLVSAASIACFEICQTF